MPGSGKGDEGLAQWGETKSKNPPPGKTDAKPRKRRLWPKLLLGLVLLLVIGVGVLIALAPSIASSMAPSIVEETAKNEIKGSVKVKEVSLSWGGPLKVGPVELYDDTGKQVGLVEVNVPTGLWTIVSEQWWSKKNLDIGQVEISGKLDVVKDGETSNLQRAVEPRSAASKPKPASSGKGGMPFDSIKGTLKLSRLDVTFTDKTAPAGTPMANGVGVSKFGGDVKLDYQPKAGTTTAKADLSGELKGAAAGEKLALTADVNLKQDSKGAIDQVAATLDVLGAPLDLVDGLAGFGGELVKSLGSRGEVRVQVNGGLDKATATLGAKSEGASADLAFEYADGAFKTAKPGVIKVRSTDFIAGMPSLKEKFAAQAKNIRLDAGPSVEITLGALSIPIPRAMLEDAMAGKPADFGALDLRRGSVDLSLAVGAQRGSINAGTLGGSKPSAPGAPAPAPEFKPFTVEPLVVRVSAPTLEGPKRITAATNATVDGKPAGQLAIDLSVTGLLNAKGQFDAGAMQKAEGEAKLLGVTTALVQPLLDAAGAPLDLAQDVGPTLDLVVKPTTTAPGGAGEIPPTDLNIAVTSANIRAAGDVRYDNKKISTPGNGLTVNIASAGPLVSRLMSKPGEPGAATVSGRLPVQLTVSDLFVDTTKTGLGDMRARAEVRVSDAAVALNLAKPADGAPAPAPAAPINLGQAVFTAALVPGTPAAVTIDAGLAHENNPFTIKGQFTAPGVVNQPKTSGAQNPIEKLLALKLGGRLDVQDVPRSLTRLIPEAYDSLNPSGADGSAEIKRLIWRMIGDNIDLAFTTEPGDNAQRAKLDLATAGVTATTSAAVSATEVNVSVFSAQASLSPSNLAPVLAAFSTKTESKDGQPPRPVTPMTLADNVTVLVTAEPLRVPFKAGTTSPDLGAVKEAVVKVTTDKPVLVSNIYGGEGKLEAGGVGNLVATARVPGSYIAESKGALIATITADVLRPSGATSGSGAWSNTTAFDICAKAQLDATLPKDPAAEQVFGMKLTDVNAVALSPLTGDPLLLPGALGDRLQIVASARMSGDEQTGKRMAVQADIDAPRLRGASIRGSTQNEVFRVDAAKMTWTPSVAWFNKTLFPPKDGQPSDQLAEEATFTLDVKSLAWATSKTGADDKPTQGPLKPGVFHADLGLTAPKLSIKRADGKQVQADDIRVVVLGGQKPGSVSLDATIGRVSGEGATGGKPSLLKATVDNLADERGVMNPSDKFVINATGDLETFPTPLVDSLANLKGKAVDFLGNTLDLKLTAQNVSKSKEGGVLAATASSPRAGAELKGVIRDNTFVQDGKFEVNIYELIRYEMAKKLPGGMPLVGFIEKKKDVDEPGQIRAEGLRIPLDTEKDMRKLNGVITVDPGTATFEFNDAFSKILKQLSQKDRGQVGRRLDPFVVTIKDGVATYDKFRLKFGEFTLETSGAADLVQKRIDVVTYVPAGAVTEEIINLFRGSIGKNSKGFTSDTRFPFTTKGPLENPKTEPDFGLFIKENAGKLLEDVGGKAVEDLLKRLKGDK